MISIGTIIKCNETVLKAISEPYEVMLSTGLYTYQKFLVLYVERKT